MILPHTLSIHSSHRAASPLRHRMEKYLSLSEVAEKLSVTPQTIIKMIKNGTLTAIRVGSQWRISETKIQEWIDGQQTQHQSGEG